MSRSSGTGYYATPRGMGDKGMKGIAAYLHNDDAFIKDVELISSLIVEANKAKNSLIKYRQVENIYIYIYIE